MKKTLIALSALAAVSAFAQSSVSLYGAADAYIGVDSKTLPPAQTVPAQPFPLFVASAGLYKKVSQNVVNSGGISPSLLGIRVKEDLGDGLNAFVGLESELQTDTGSTSNTRRSVVGLGGSFGSLALGRQATPLKDGVVKLADAQGDSAFSAFNHAAANSITASGTPGMVPYSPYTQYINNSIRYDTPDLNGFHGALAVGTAQAADKSPTPDRVVSLSAAYVVPGSWAVGFAHQTEKNGQNTSVVPGAPFANGVTVGGNKVSMDYLSAAVGTPIGKFTLGFGGGKVDGIDGHDKGWNLGWMAPIGSWTLLAQVAQFKATGALGNLYNTGNTWQVNPALAPTPPFRSGSAKRTSFGIEARYSLSKRTTLYTGYNQTKNLLGIADAKASLFGVGMRHDF